MTEAAAHNRNFDQRPSLTMRVHACLECGEGHQKPGEFCSKRCRHRFNNRRKTRGAELIDLYMALRFDRPAATRLGLFQAISRLASIYREEDREHRDGRRSWRKPHDVLMERPYLRSIATKIRSGR